MPWPPSGICQHHRNHQRWCCLAQTQRTAMALGRRKPFYHWRRFVLSRTAVLQSGSSTVKSGERHPYINRVRDYHWWKFVEPQHGWDRVKVWIMKNHTQKECQCHFLKLLFERILNPEIWIVAWKVQPMPQQTAADRDLSNLIYGSLPISVISSGIWRQKPLHQQSKRPSTTTITKVLRPLSSWHKKLRSSLH